MNGVLALGLLGVAAYIDWKSYKIYNKHVLAGFLAGLFYHAYYSGWPGAEAALMAGLAGGAILFPAWICGAIGGGDVKLYAALGAILGFPFLIKTTLWLVIYSLLWAVPILIWKKRLKASLQWTYAYLKYLLLKTAVFGLHEKEEPIVEDGTKIKFSLVIAAAVGTLLVIEGGLVFEILP